MYYPVGDFSGLPKFANIGQSWRQLSWNGQNQKTRMRKCEAVSTDDFIERNKNSQTFTHYDFILAGRGHSRSIFDQNPSYVSILNVYLTFFCMSVFKISYISVFKISRKSVFQISCMSCISLLKISWLCLLKISHLCIFKISCMPVFQTYCMSVRTK